MRWRMRLHDDSRVLASCLLLLLCLMPFSPPQSAAQSSSTDLSGVKVAIYNGIGVMPSSRSALTCMFEWMNATVANVTSIDIKNGSLDSFDILVVPGGSESTASSELGTEGRQMVRNFVNQGGSYFGICGGATFGARNLGFFKGSMSVLTEPGSIMHMTIMHINRTCDGPDLSSLPENVSVMYYNSQYFVPNTGFSMYPIATYDYNGRAGMIAFNQENGTVFLSSPHAEYEEDDDRDDTTFADSFEDPESEWDLLLRVSKWLVEASYVEPADTTTTTNLPNPGLSLILGAIAGGSAIVLVVYGVYRIKYK